MRDTSKNLSADQARVMFAYSPETGNLIWKYPPDGKPSNRARLAGRAAGSVKNGYVLISCSGNKLAAHRIIWLYHHGEWPAGEIDHIDGDKANNRIENLRVATRSENMRNVAAYRSSASGIKGVHYHVGERKWRAAIMLDRKTFALGRFDTAEAARSAYEQAAKEKHGTFARIV